MTAPGICYADGTVTVHLARCQTALADMSDASVDAIVTDPPYEIAFMGRRWDASGVAYDVAMWRECLRILKPGGHLLAFGATRTYHRMVCAIEDAGFEIRDSIHWIYGSGFPKSLDVSKAIDKAAGAVREVVGVNPLAVKQTAKRGTAALGDFAGVGDLTAPATDDAARWQGWGTALKPAHEPIALARKPFPGTVAGNVLTHGTGALNIDACRITAGQDYRDKCASVVGLGSNRNGDAYGEWTGTRVDSAHAAGRWPTNVVLTHQALLDGDGDVIGDACEHGCVPGCPVADMDAQSGYTRDGVAVQRNRAGVKRTEVYGKYGVTTDDQGFGGAGGASRFFPVFRYEAKAPAAERPRLPDGTAHATVKPLALMRWLVRLITPPGGLICDPFAGSGTTGEAAVVEGFCAVLVEEDPAHAELIKARLSKPIQPTLGEAS